MKFMNEGAPVQVRESDGPGRFKFKCVGKGETINLPRKIGLAYGLEVTKSDQKLPEVTEGKIGQTKVETKQFEKPLKKNEEFQRKLRNIKGIGRKTVEDIIKVYPTEEKMINAIKSNQHLPFRDDIEEKLRKEYDK